LSTFPELAEKTIYITDGGLDVILLTRSILMAGPGNALFELLAIMEVRYLECKLHKPNPLTSNFFPGIL
jgi:hypothetical protein